jgi:serine protease Do
MSMKYLFALCLAVAAAGNAHAQVDRASFIGLGASVLKIEVLRAQGGYALGSGVVVRPGKVVTNCHVTRDAAQIHVVRGSARWRVESQAVDVDRDLCVLYTPGIKAAVVTLGRSAELKVGQAVTALGFTGGLGIQNSPGDVVALHRHDNSSVIQSSNWFSSGASGGGLFDDELRLVGILTYRLRGGAAHYFAAPVDWLHGLLDDSARYLPVQPIAANLLAYWQRPVAMQPNFLRAALLERDSHWAELEDLASRWTRTDADDPEPWYRHGIALEQLNRLADAQRALERSVSIEPSFCEAWFRLGMVHTRRGQRENAQRARARLEALKSDLAPRLTQAIEKL